MTLHLLSEPYSPAGSMVATTLTRAVRNTSLDEWALLLRETLQNSVDARLFPSRPIHYHASLEHLTHARRGALQREVFTEFPPNQLRRLQQVLKRPDLSALVVADWDTRGLCGPTRADVETRERPNFRDFFLNVGREGSKGFGGGTFGLGRGVLFDISDPGTIVAFTRTTFNDKPVARLMAMAIGETYAANRVKYTGRHWWGADTRHDWPEPVTGASAERVATAIGLDVIPEGKLGTAIMVIEPRIPQGHTLENALDEMIEATRLYGWPLMIGKHGKPTVRFEFGLDGEFWEPDAPDAPDSPVRRFVEAYRRAETEPSDAPTSWRRNDIKFGAGRAKPQTLGHLVFRHYPPISQGILEEDVDDIIPAASVALMRAPRMVVKYLAAPRHPQGASTVGVFIADDAFDSEFAKSEPVAHDDWIPAKVALAKFERNPVRQALDKIKQTVRDSWRSIPESSGSSSGADEIAPVIGDLLGGMVADTPGFGGGRMKPPPGKGKGGKARVRAVVQSPALRLQDADVVAAFPVTLTGVSAAARVRLTAEARVLLDNGGTEGPNDRPEGAPVPAVLGWESEGRQVAVDATEVVVDATAALTVLVQQPRDTAVTLAVSAEEVPA